MTKDERKYIQARTKEMYNNRVVNGSMTLPEFQYIGRLSTGKANNLNKAIRVLTKEKKYGTTDRP